MTKTYFAVAGIVMNGNKILIMKKSASDRNYPEHWSFCSGFVKEFEAGEDTVLREIKEETGIDASIVKGGKIKTVLDKNMGKRWVVQVFLCKADKKEVKLDHENSEYKWVSLKELFEHKFVPGLKKDLNAVGMI